MKARLILEHQGRLSVRRKSQLAELPRSSFYASRDRSESQRERRNRYLLMFIMEVYKQSRHTYGSRRIHAELRGRGISCSLNRVARLMKQHGIVAARTRLMEQLTNEVRPMLQAAGVPENRYDPYFRTVRHYCHIADWFDPGTPEQAKAIEEHLADALMMRLGRDPALARKAGEFTLRRYGELKPALPPDPHQRG